VSGVAQLLPIFPLDAVLLPGAPLPLHIFEPRYRALVADVWPATDRASGPAGFGIVSMRYPGHGGAVNGPGRPVRTATDDDAAGEPDDESPARDASSGLAVVGTFASILEVEPYEDGRSDLLTVGGRRFRLLELERTDKPYLQARVDWLEEDGSAVSESLAEAARSRCARYLAELAQLAGRELPPVKFAGDPVTLSYQVAGRMRLATSERQSLLEAATAAERLRAALALLRREIVLLGRTRSVPVSPGLLQVESRPN
jgi:Lon protease-like protein